MDLVTERTVDRIDEVVFYFCLIGIELHALTSQNSKKEKEMMRRVSEQVPL